MNPTEAENTIRQRVSITRQRVLIAKAITFNVTVSTITCDDILAEVYNANNVVVPRPVVLHESVDTDAALAAVADSISWRIATNEAIWSLIHSGLLVALADVRSHSFTIDWTTVVPGSSGMSGGWQFADYAFPVPSRVRRTASSLQVSNQFLSEPDLYLHSIAAPAMHQDVVDAFTEAVKCFRSELFTASLAMLGKASEGAWLELGASLVELALKSGESKYSKQCSILEDPMIGTYKKIEAVLAIFDHQDDFGTVSKLSGVRLQELRAVAVWSDAVRDARNTIHFGVMSTTPNTYEKLAALLLGAVSNVRVIYRVKEAADKIVKGI